MKTLLLVLLIAWLLTIKLADYHLGVAIPLCFVYCVLAGLLTDRLTRE